jgi:hypothetical protein
MGKSGTNDLVLSADLRLPLRVVTEKLAWIGRTGSGKSYGALKAAELMLDAGAQIGAIDPVGIWRALRVPAKGGRSFEVVVFGGLYGDLPLEPTEAAGVLVADLVVDRGVSFVLDVSQFIPAEQQRFVRGFVDRFFHRKKSKPSAVHLFLEECQEFIPENPAGDEKRTLGVMQRMWKLGRNFGIGGSLISQRPQEVSKKAFNMSGTLFAFQMTGPQERKAVKDWVVSAGVAADILNVLQTLAVGQPHVESPSFLEVSKTVRILERVTADLSSTPQVGTAKAAARPLTPIDIEQLKVSMAATIERAKDEDPKALRAAVAQRDKTIKALEAAVKLANESSALSVPTPKAKTLALAKDLKRLESAVARLEKAQHVVDDAIFKAAGSLSKNQDAVATALNAVKVVLSAATTASTDKVVPTASLPAATRPAGAPPFTVQPAPRPAPPRSFAPAGEERAVGNGGLRRILVALAQRPQGLTSSQLGIRASISSTSGTFDTYMSRARKAGWIVGSGNAQITEAGLAALGHYNALPEGAELREHWMRSVKGAGARRLLQVLADAYPNPMTSEQLGQAAGIAHTSGTFDTYMSRLRTLQLIEGRGAEIRMSAELAG